MKQPCGEDSCFECPFEDCILNGDNKPSLRKMNKFKRKSNEQKTNLFKGNNLPYTGTVS